jgi:hypothetical protein
MSQKPPIAPERAAGDNLSPAQKEQMKRKAARRGQAPRDRRGLWAALTIAVIAVVLIGGAIVIDTGQQQQRLAPRQTAEARVEDSVSEPITSTLANDIPGVQAFKVEQGHTIAKVSYPQMPPPGGTHNPEWQNCGIYDTPVDAVNGVHSMEHGASWIAYRPDVGPSAIENLRGLVRGRPYTLLSPMQEASAPIVAAAWGLRLEVTDANDPRLAQFISTFTNGPQTPELGAACTGAKGQPIE